MTTSFPETKTGLRLGLASAAVTGFQYRHGNTCSPACRLAPNDANPVLAKVNGSEIRQSDLVLAEEDTRPQPGADGPGDQEGQRAVMFLSRHEDRRQGRQRT